MKLQDCINFQLTVTQNAVFSYFKGALATLDVTPAQYALLSCLWEKDGQAPSRLASRLQLDPASMSGLITRTEAKGFITREYSSTNRRTYKIRVTERGKLMQEPITEVIRQCNQQVLQGISPSDYKVFLKCINVFSCNTQVLDE